MNQKQTKAAVEAMLFAAGDPVSADKLCSIWTPAGSWRPRPSGPTASAACWTRGARCPSARRRWRR